MKQVKGQFPIQGSNHVIWDILIAEETKMCSYLDYILDKEIVMQDAMQSVTTVKERLNKKPIETANNTIYFLNGLTEDELKTTNIKDTISIITWARKVMIKHQYLDTVEAKIDIMNHQIKLVIESFSPLCKKVYLSFGRKRVKCFPKKIILISWSNVD